MNQLLNSSFTQWALKWGLSKTGIIALAIVGWLISRLNMAAYICGEGIATCPDLDSFRTWAVSALIAGFTWLMAWLVERQKTGVKALQVMHNELSPQQSVPVDGIAGNKTVAAVAKASDMSASEAKAVVEQAKTGEKAGS